MKSWETDKSDWCEVVAYGVANKLSVQLDVAKQIVSDQEEALNKAWEMGMNCTETAEAIVNASKA